MVEGFRGFYAVRCHGNKTGKGSLKGSTAADSSFSSRGLTTCVFDLSSQQLVPPRCYQIVQTPVLFKQNAAWWRKWIFYDVTLLMLRWKNVNKEIRTATVPPSIKI
jgi:hypothetical protein